MGLQTGTSLCDSVSRDVLTELMCSAWASAHRGKWGQLTPPAGKIDEKLKKNKKHAIRAGRCRERRYADHIFIQIYFRMHHFVVKFSKKFASGGKGALTP